MEYFKILPEEITLEIISRVPTESVLECKLVCTNWRSLVRHPSFSKMHVYHLNHPAADSGKLGFIAWTSIDGWKNEKLQYFEYNENHESIERIRRLNFKPPFGYKTRFVGSCNGLICLYQDNYCLPGKNYISYPGKTYICNPITRECTMLPEIKSTKLDRGAMGFGYVSSTNEYKVVTIMFKSGINFVETYIYTLGSGIGWRNLGEFNVGPTLNWKDHVFVDGALYWWDYMLKMIVRFDLAEQKFWEHLSSPLSPDNCLNGVYKLGVMDGCLSLGINRDGCWYLWLMKKKDDSHGMKEREGRQSLGWSDVFRVYDRELFAITKSCAFLTYNRNHIKIHDLEASTLKTIVAFKERFYKVLPHKNTIVSLKELGEEDTKMMDSVEIEDQPFNQL